MGKISEYKLGIVECSKYDVCLFCTNSNSIGRIFTFYSIRIFLIILKIFWLLIIAFIKFI